MIFANDTTRLFCGTTEQATELAEMSRNADAYYAKMLRDCLQRERAAEIDRPEPVRGINRQRRRDRRLVTALFDVGYSVREVARMVVASPSTVQRALSDAEVEDDWRRASAVRRSGRRRALPPAAEDAMLARVNAGESVMDVADDLGVSKSTAYLTLRRLREAAR